MRNAIPAQLHAGGNEGLRTHSGQPCKPRLHRREAERDRVVHSLRLLVSRPLLDRLKAGRGKSQPLYGSRLRQSLFFRFSQFPKCSSVFLTKAIYHELHGEQGQHVVRKEIPENLEATARESRLQLLDVLSQLDDQLLECLLNDVEPSEEDLHRVIRRATLTHQLTPVFLGSAYRNKGVQEVLTAVTRYLPSPSDR